MTIKKCFKCLCEKPLEAFYKHSMMADGHLNKCKECTKNDVAKHKQENLEKVRQYDKMRASMPHRISKTAQVVKEYRKTFPERAKANAMVAYALRNGKLSRGSCVVCGAKAVAHHPDYSKPLDVVWLCQPHHKQEHARMKHD